MKAKIWIKWLIGIFALVLMLSFGVACKGEKGEIEQPPHQFSIQFYATSERDNEEMQSFKAINHNGCEPRMYVYTQQDSFGEPIYVKLDKLEDIFGQEIDQKFYQVNQEPKWAYVEVSQTLIWEYTMYRYDEDNELYPAYAIRIQWEILIGECDDKPIQGIHGEWIMQSRVSPTCTESGHTVYVCACGCGSTRTEYEDPKGHDWGNWQAVNNGKHQRFCNNDFSHHEIEACHGGVATCKEQASCEDCGWTYGAVGDHAYRNGVCIYCESGEYSINVTFRLSDDKSYYIAIRRYLSDADKEYFGAQLETLKIPAIYQGKPVKEIENHAFDDQTYTKKVVIAEGVEKIGYYAFKGCSNLSSINIPLSLKVIENNAFDGTLYANTAENWTDGVLYLNNWLIDVDDTKTGACTVKDGTVGIIGNAFKSSKFSEIIFPDSVEYFDTNSQCFSRSQEKISFGAGVKTLSGKMFASYNNEELSITISEENPYYNIQDEFLLSEDGKTLVEYFGNDSEVTIPNGVEKIGAYGLYNKLSIQKVHIPDGVKEIGEHAFYVCQYLQEIILPDSMQKIGDLAFYGSDAVTRLSIGAGLQEIGELAFGYVGSELAEIELSENNTSFKLDDGVLYTADGKTLLLYPSADTRTSYTVGAGTELLSGFAFCKSNNLREIILPSSLKILSERGLFICDNLRKLVIPDSVHTIQTDAVCSDGLISLTIGKGVKEISDYAFRSCYRLVDVYNRSSIRMDSLSVYSSIGYSNQVPVYTNPDDCKLTTDENGFVFYVDGDEVILVDYIGEETDLIIPNGVTKIGDWALSGAVLELTSVTLSDSVEVIGERAFSGHNGTLIKVVCGTGLREIQECAFQQCDMLEEIILNSTLEKIGRDAFTMTKINPSYDREPIDGIYIGEHFLRPAYSAKSFIIREGTVLLENASIFVVPGYNYEYDWVVIPKSVVSIGEADDYYISAPKAIYYVGTQEEWQKMKNYQLVADSTMYYYSEVYAENGWRYVKGVPTTWLEDGTQYEEVAKVLLETSDGEEGIIGVTRGQEIQLVTKIYPENHVPVTNVTYKILEEESTKINGKFLGILDASTGFLKITYDLNRGYCRLKVVAIVDGIESNVLTFQMERVEVTSIRFIPEVTYLYARPGETLTLQAKVNEDAANQGVWYSFREESPYASMVVNGGAVQLTISEDFNDWAEHIYVIAHASNGITAEQTIIILKEEYHLLLNNQIEDVYLYADTEMTLTIEDGEGNSIPLSDATIKIYDEDFKETDDFTIDANGKLIPKDGFYLDKTTVYTIEALFGESEEFFSYVWLYVSPSPLEVTLKITPNRVAAGEYIDFEFVVISNYPATKFENFQIVILGGNAEVVDENTIYVLPTALKGGTISVRARWTDEYGRTIDYHYYILTVE